MMTKKLAIVGASGHGKVVAEIAEQLGFTVSFYDDAYPSKTHIEHWPINGTSVDLIAFKNVNNNVVVAIGNNEIRQQKIELFLQNSFNLITLIHPSAIVSKYATIDQGTVIFAGAIINAFSKVGVGCIINTAAIVEHDCMIDDFTHICPNTALAGGVIVGRQSWIGIGSNVKQLVTIGSNCLIGAGSTVVKNIPDDVTVFGSPAVCKT